MEYITADVLSLDFLFPHHLFRILGGSYQLSKNLLMSMPSKKLDNELPPLCSGSWNNMSEGEINAGSIGFCSLGDRVNPISLSVASHY